MTGQPVLYSFRRCPYAMRARMALLISGQKVELREVVLRDKPEAMLHQSSKGTVPVLVQTDGQVLDESLDVIYWALDQSDPEGWLTHKPAAQPLIAQSDAEFKYHLDRYKYPNRYDDVDPDYHRAEGLKFLQKLDGMIAAEGQIFGAGLMRRICPHCSLGLQDIWGPRFLLWRWKNSPSGSRIRPPLCLALSGNKGCLVQGHQ